VNQTKKRRRQQKWGTLFIQWFAVLYLLFFIGYELTSPTTAYFQDTKEVTGSIRAADTFDNNQKESDKLSESQPNEKQSAINDRQPDGNHNESIEPQSHPEEKNNDSHQTKDNSDSALRQGNQNADEEEGSKGVETKTVDSQTNKSGMPETSSNVDGVKEEKTGNGEQKK
jgi:YqxM protein